MKKPAENELFETRVGNFWFDEHFAEWRSASTRVPALRGHEVEFAVEVGDRFEDNPYPTKEEIAVFERFLSLPKGHSDLIKPHLWQFYLDARQAWGSEEIPKIDSPDNVWQHLGFATARPYEWTKEDMYLVIEGGCDWEPEHGLLLSLQNGTRWARVSDYDGHPLDESHDWIKDPNEVLPVRRYYGY